MKTVDVTFNSQGLGVCPVCKKTKHYMSFQHIRHCQSAEEVEVCTDCKSDFIKINDIFFRGIF